MWKAIPLAILLTTLVGCASETETGSTGIETDGKADSWENTNTCRIDTGESGVCIDRMECDMAGGARYPGYCPGASNIQCCISAPSDHEDAWSTRQIGQVELTYFCNYCVNANEGCDESAEPCDGYIQTCLDEYDIHQSSCNDKLYYVNAQDACEFCVMYNEGCDESAEPCDEYVQECLNEFNHDMSSCGW